MEKRGRKTSTTKWNRASVTYWTSFLLNISKYNIHIIGVPEGGQPRRDRKIFKEIMAKLYPNLLKTLTYKSKKPHKPQAGCIKRKPH